MKIPRSSQFLNRYNRRRLSLLPPPLRDESYSSSQVFHATFPSCIDPLSYSFSFLFRFSLFQRSLSLSLSRENPRAVEERRVTRKSKILSSRIVRLWRSWNEQKSLDTACIMYRSPCNATCALWHANEFTRFNESFSQSWIELFFVFLFLWDQIFIKLV